MVGPFGMLVNYDLPTPFELRSYLDTVINDCPGAGAVWNVEALEFATLVRVRFFSDAEWGVIGFQWYDARMCHGRCRVLVLLVADVRSALDN